jgi:hypothetical protein
MKRATHIPRVRPGARSVAITAWTCANPGTKAHVRIFTKRRDTALSHAKKWGCQMCKIRVLAVARLLWIPGVGVEETELNPATTKWNL